MAKSGQWTQSSWTSGAPRQSAETITTTLLNAAHRQWAGDSGAGAYAGSRLANRFATQPGMIENAARQVVAPLIAAAWTNGWSPEDLHQIARRRLGTAAVSYLVDAIAEESRQYAAAALHDRWRDQLRQIGAVVWWESREGNSTDKESIQGHLLQWAQRHHCDLAETLTTVIEVMVLLLSLPRLPTIVPPPGSAATSVPRRGVDHKVLTRVRALLAKAESTTFPEEAEALSTKAQELMSRYSLQRLVVEAEPGSDPQPAAARRLWLDSPYVAAKALLVDAVAEANRCRTALSEKIGFITVLGDEVDLEIVELLTTSLLVQATRAMVSAGSQTSRTGQSRTRSYRQSFLIAYATRIRERLSTARDASTAAVSDPAQLLPVLAARKQVVDQLFQSMFPESVYRSMSVGNTAGWHAGRAAADLAVLDVHHSVTSGHS